MVAAFGAGLAEEEREDVGAVALHVGEFRAGEGGEAKRTEANTAAM